MNVELMATVTTNRSRDHAADKDNCADGNDFFYFAGTECGQCQTLITQHLKSCFVSSQLFSLPFDVVRGEERWACMNHNIPYVVIKNCHDHTSSRKRKTIFLVNCFLGPLAAYCEPTLSHWKRMRWVHCLQRIIADFSYASARFLSWISILRE